MNRSQLRITACHDGGDSNGSHRIGNAQSMVLWELVAGEQAWSMWGLVQGSCVLIIPVIHNDYYGQCVYYGYSQPGGGLCPS